MSTETIPALPPTTAPKRRVPRYSLSVPLHLTVLRSGVPDNIPGRTREIGEGGMGVVVASRLLLGESVRVEFLLPHMTTPVRATAVVRYQREQCFGLQFLRLPEEQQSIIRYWTRREADIVLVTQKPSAAQAAAMVAGTAAESTPLPDLEGSENSKRRPRIRRMVVSAVLVFVVAAMLGWWRWQQGWKELEARVTAGETVVAEPQWQVPADVMQQRIRYQVMPEYPEGARLAGVQGTVVLDAIVSVEGAVARVKVVSGPEALAAAASDAVRWWRYEPYLVNGQPATVQTTVALDFRLPNDMR
jgi:TonB family protein